MGTSDGRSGRSDLSTARCGHCPKNRLKLRGESRISARELLSRVDLSRPTLYRLLRTLELRGFVASFGEPQRFSLGPAIAQLSQAWSSGNDITELARPVMERLWEATGETVALLIHIAFASNQAMYLDLLPDERRQAYEVELKRIRSDGYAVSREELIPGAIAMAVPIFVASKQVVGSLAVYGPSVRIGEKQISYISELLLQASTQLSQSLGA